MTLEITAEVVRVFTNEDGEFGNPVGVVFDTEHQLTHMQRQYVATTLGYSETVFVDNLQEPEVSIFDTTHQVRFAGHAIVGTAWLISSLRKPPTKTVRCSGMDLPTWQDGAVRWVRAAMSLTPGWNHEQLDSPALVDAITNEQGAAKEHVFVWAWQDEADGIVRARTFLPDWDILEDQGNGSGSMQRAVALGREIKIIHGLGSVIYARPADNDQAEVGGRVRQDASRIVMLPAAK